MARENRKQQNNGLEFKCTNIREFEDGNISFTLTIGRISIYGCRIFTGKNGEFISWPSRCVKATKKGEKDRYFNHARVNDLTDAEQTEIINTVYALLDEDEKDQ